jgi:hypothetical protein
MIPFINHSCENLKSYIEVPYSDLDRGNDEDLFAHGYDLSVSTTVLVPP